MAKKTFTMREEEVESLATLLRDHNELDSDDMIGIAREFFEELPAERKVEVQGALLNVQDQKEMRRRIAETLTQQFQAEKLYTAKELDEGDITRLTTYLTTEAYNIALQQKQEFQNEGARIDREEKPKYLARHIIGELPEQITQELIPRLETTTTQDDLEALLADSTEVVRETITAEQQATLAKIQGIKDGIDLVAVDPETIEDIEIRARYNQQVYKIMEEEINPLLVHSLNRPATRSQRIMLEYEAGIIRDIVEGLKNLKPIEGPYQVGDKVKFKWDDKDREGVILFKGEPGEDYAVHFLADGGKRWVSPRKIEQIVEEGELRKLVAEHGYDKEKIAEILLERARAKASVELKDQMIDSTKRSFEEKYDTSLKSKKVDPKKYLAKLRKAAEEEFQADKSKKLRNAQRQFGNKFRASPENEDQTIHNSIESLVNESLSEGILGATWEKVSTSVTSEAQKEGLVKKHKHPWRDPVYKVEKDKLGNILEGKTKREMQVFLGEQLVKDKVNPIAWDGVTYAYVIDPNAEVPEGARVLDPFRIGEEYLADLMTIMAKYVTGGKQEDKLAIARELILNGRIPSMEEVTKVLAKPSKKLLKEILEAAEGEQLLTPTSRAFNVFAREDPRNANVRTLQREARNLGQGAQYTAARDLIVSDLLQLFQQNGGKDRHRDFELVWQKYHPELFDLPNINFRVDVGQNMTTEYSDQGEFPTELLPAYIFSVERNMSRLEEAAQKSRSCMHGQDIVGFLNDPGSVNFVQLVDGRPDGYGRILYMTDKDTGKPVFAVDTYEVGHKQFLKRNDRLRAMGLATIQLALDSGVQDLIGKDKRVSYGLRQAFGNKQQKYNLKKHGILNTQGQHSFFCYKDYNHQGEIDGQKSAMLFHNWRRE